MRFVHDVGVRQTHTVFMSGRKMQVRDSVLSRVFKCSRPEKEDKRQYGITHTYEAWLCVLLTTVGSQPGLPSRGYPTNPELKTKVSLGREGTEQK